MSVLPKLREHLKAQGSISVAEYMELCNQHYYATRDPFGAQGDFTTAPEISQIFGELIGAWLAQQWMLLGSPRAVLCELGPGRGTLMKDILRATRNVPQFHASILIRMVETSPVLQALQKQTLQGSHPDIAWKTSLEALPSLPLLLVANEFFDALPIRQFVGEEERKVTLSNETLAFSPQAEVTREDSPASAAIMQQILAALRQQGGTALLIDYGYNGGQQKDTLQAVRQHAFCDPLTHAGEADLTAHVDFAALESLAHAKNLHTHYTTQGDFLRRLGAELRATALCQNANHQQRTTILQGLERLLSPEQMGTLFKVLAITSSLEKPVGF